MTDQPTPETEPEDGPADGRDAHDGAKRAQGGSALWRAHVALAAQASRDRAALKRLRDRVQAVADEARGSIRDWLVDALADLPDPRQPSTVTALREHIAADGQAACIHPDGYGGECPCPSSYGCCKATPALHFHLAPAGLREQIVATLEDFPVACWTPGSIASRVMPLVGAAFDAYRDAINAEQCARTTPDNPATSSDTADNPLQQLIADTVRPWLLGADEADVQHCATAVVDAILPTTRLLGELARSSDADVKRVIALYERWQQIDLPKDRESRPRWWDERLTELHDAILPPDQPAAHDGGPTVAECAEADRVWPLQREGE